MKLLIILTLTGLAASLDLQHVLESPAELRNLFSEFSADYGKTFSPSEAPMRMRLFKRDLRRIVKLNKENDWVSGINQFTAMTAAEKREYLGLNISMAAPAPEMDDLPPRDDAPRASSLDWREKGKVTAVQNQGRCGSCWAFSAVGAVETKYAVLAEKRKKFAEQEYLDCTFEGRDGCNGGWYHEAWDYSVKNKRLATAAAAPYKGSDGPCSYSDVHNGLIAALVTGSKRIGNGESNVIEALNSGAVSVAYEVTNSFFAYKSGVIRDNTCRKHSPSHAVVAVGYTEDAVILKNSWSSQWGMEGYFQTGRNHHGCGIWKYGYVPTLEKTDKEDTDPES